MNKLILLIALLTIFFSCTRTDKTESERIRKFEEFLGKEKVEILDLAVVEFEKFILNNTKTQNLDSAYVEILRYFLNNPNSYDSLEIDRKKQKEITSLMKDVGLWKEIWTQPSKVYYENGIIKFEHEYQPDDTSQLEIIIQGELIYPKDEVLNIDSLIEDYKKVRDFYYYGDYFQALEAVSDNDTTLINYLDNVEAAGSQSSYMIAHAFLYYKLDYTSYFISRILAIELYF